MTQEHDKQQAARQRVVMDALGKHGVPSGAVKADGDSTILIDTDTRLSAYQRIIRGADWFPGEVEALADEFEGRFVVGLERLPLHKQAKITEWLSYPRDEREKAYEAAVRWAERPVAAALDMLKNPGKYQGEEKPEQASEPALPDYTWW